MTLNDIRKPIEIELDTFEKHFRDSMKSSVPLLDKITGYIVQRKGKQMRPIFVFLSAKLCGEINNMSYVAASLVELLHTATLVHDDVVDESYERRGFFSVNALWKNKIAVLVGDYLLSQGLSLALKNEGYLILKIMSNAVKEMAEGELLQIEKARKLDIDEEVYYQIIKQKTASLIAAACSVGAASSTTDNTLVEKMRLLGENVGMAFQIRDDLFDFGIDDVGKPLGIDIKEKKMTLPLIHALNVTNKTTRAKMINIVRRESHRPEKVKEVIDFVRSSGGLEFAEKKMEYFCINAFEILEEFPQSDARTAFEQLIDYVTKRKK